MEENRKSRILTLACSLLSALAGIAGALAVMNEGWGFLWLPEKLVFDGLVGGAILGFGVGFTSAKMKPDRSDWRGAQAVTVLIRVSAIVSSGVGAAFYVACRRFLA